LSDVQSLSGPKAKASGGGEEEEEEEEEITYS
jgi:hypothetical protein